MKEKEFMKQVAESEMPNIDEVRKNCIAQIKEGKIGQKKKYKLAVFGGTIVATAMLLCLCIPPINSFARNAVQQIKVLLKLNDSAVQIGETQESVINIPNDCEKVEVEGVTYLTKSYNDLSAVVKDIGIDIYTWQGTDKFEKDGIMLNIVENDYGRIALLYDVAGGADFDQASKDELQFVKMLIYIPLSEDTTLGDLMLENEQLKTSTVDDEGYIEEYKQNTEYEMIEQYQSPRLNTTVTVIGSNVKTEMSGDIIDATDNDSMYYLYFTLDGMCYQVGCDGTLDAAHRVVEEIGKSGLETITKKQGFSGTKEQSINDLLYREINGDSISVEKGDKVTLLPSKGMKYKDVSLYLLGKGTVLEVGDFREDKTCSFTADVSGEYVMYSGDKNITSEIIVEIGKNEKQDDILYID